MDYKEHGTRVWSVDFPQSNPTKLSSGSDDCIVKLWSINQGGSLSTIRTKSNVWCVQFQPNSGHLIALGSAGYKIYCYDLRNIQTPWYILESHSKTMSYMKFLDSALLVSASTDNTLKLWDLSNFGEKNMIQNRIPSKNNEQYILLHSLQQFLSNWTRIWSS